MFRVLVTLLTIATMLAHAVLGCCWHAGAGCAHRCDAVCCTSEPATTECHDHDDHGDECKSHVQCQQVASTSEPVQEMPEPAAPVCTHGKCVYVLADVLTTTSIDQSVSYGTWPLLSTDLGISVALDFRDALWRFDRAAGPPLRARAQLQVWLI